MVLAAVFVLSIEGAMHSRLLAYIIVFGLGISSCMGQESEKHDTIPTAVQWALDAAGPAQRSAIKSVFLLYCPKTQMKGTGFLLSDGLIITNHHVVEGCTAEEVKANPFGAQEVGFDKMAIDKDVDLAVLRPSKHLSGGLELGSDVDPLLGTSVNTWGFPLTYNGTAPLLSVGYIAGYVKDGESGKEVKHVVVNGAFNLGNSGGPLFKAGESKVIGVVVAKFNVYQPFVKDAIATLSNNKFGMMYGARDEHGNPTQVSEAQVVALILDQFYKTTQVMIGEAISVSELRAFLKKKKPEVQ
jgi:S1-C subfamily serine protease